MLNEFNFRSSATIISSPIKTISKTKKGTHSAKDAVQTLSDGSTYHDRAMERTYNFEIFCKVNLYHKLYYYNFSIDYQKVLLV